MSIAVAETHPRAAERQAEGGARTTTCSVRRTRDRVVVAGVILMVVAWHGLSAADVGLWVQPDSVGYVALADWLVRHADIRHEWFVSRTPGYPLLLAAIERMYGGLPPAPILLVQHTLAIGAAALTGWLAWMLTRSRAVALLAFLSTGLSLSLTAYANVVLTEVPFTTALLATLCLAMRYVQSGRRGALLLSSLCAGIAALFRPVGLPLGLLPVAALALRMIGARGGPSAWRPQRLLCAARRGALLLVMAVGPFAAVAVGWSLSVRAVHGADGTGNFGSYNLYLRLVTREGLTEPSSPALEAIRESVAWANQRRPPEAQLDDRVDIHAVMAYRQHHECSWAEASSKLGDAAWVICKAHPWTVLKGTFRNAAHTLLSVDPVHRRRPEAEVRTCRGDGVEWLSTAEYEQDFLTRLRPWMSGVDFHVKRDGSALSAAMTRLLGVIDRAGLRAPAPRGLPGDTLYETWVYVCLAGGLALMIRSRQRRLWWLTGLALALPLAVSSFTPGEDPRFAVPLRPVLNLWGGTLLSVAVAVTYSRVGHAIHVFLRSRRTSSSRMLAGP